MRERKVFVKKIDADFEACVKWEEESEITHRPYQKPRGCDVRKRLEKIYESKMNFGEEKHVENFESLIFLLHIKTFQQTFLFSFWSALNIVAFDFHDFHIHMLLSIIYVSLILNLGKSLMEVNKITNFIPNQLMPVNL